MIKVGDYFPVFTMKRVGDEGLIDVSLSPYFTQKKVVVFGVPGAFTPTCSRAHVPSFVENSAALKAQGIDHILCISVNDPFVLQAWANQVDPHGDIIFVSDGNGTLTTQMGLEKDLSAGSLGLRSCRYAMIVENECVKALFVEDSPGKCDVSSAQKVLDFLSNQS